MRELTLEMDGKILSRDEIKKLFKSDKGNKLRFSYRDSVTREKVYRLVKYIVTDRYKDIHNHYPFYLSTVSFLTCRFGNKPILMNLSKRWSGSFDPD